ncbi:MAG: NADH:ubiquinone reductase (Na(+)-transporting) subunit C [Cryomorphaceae bacterium]|nr:NADH:ubiquinone reductase (Na(+)-transporting) subunit C [Flavobacteriales bacterium]
MAINKNSNAFTFTFAILMVIIVGATLSFAAISLKPRQVENAIQKEMISILSSVGVEANRDNASDLFYANIKERITLNHSGEVIANRQGKVDAQDADDPFNIDVQKEYRNPNMKPEDRSYPAYLAEVDGTELVVVPMVGKGLWGPIWGYVALKGDYNTIYGAVFSHKSETPGLGAEISEGFFQEPFEGKQIYDDSGNMVSVDVKKSGDTSSDPHAVDGITGGTITSVGVQEMMRRTFGVYDKYFQSKKANITELR